MTPKGLLGDHPWNDPFQVHWYYLWHHEGRRMRMVPALGGADYTHWHGSFECMHRIYEMQEIYKKRIASGKIE